MSNDQKHMVAQEAQQMSVEEALEHAKRAFALKKYEQAVDYYATALEKKTKQCGEDSPETADLYYAYGKALLENAISQSSVLGKEQGDDPANDVADNSASGSDPSNLSAFFSFSGDGDDIEPNGEDDATIDIFAEAAKAEAEDPNIADDENEDPDAEPEDDFNAAWEVLDLARALFEKLQQTDEESKLKLADTYMALGDVSLETEKFDQAIRDYTSGLQLKQELLPSSSRHIAEAHYRLSLVLDMTPGRLSDAIIQLENALESVNTRLSELHIGLNQNEEPIPPVLTTDRKGKGKMVDSPLLMGDLVQNMSKSDIESEIREMEGLRIDLVLKVEEMKTAPNEESTESAPVLAAKALDKELNGASSATAIGRDQVNDLTSIVKKKKKASEVIGLEDAMSGKGNGKRKATEEHVEGSPGDKKLKLES